MKACVRMNAVLVLCVGILRADAGEALRQFAGREKTIWTAPLRIERKHLPWLGAFALTTAALVSTDVRISRGLPNSDGQLRWGARLSRTGSSYGVLGLGGGLLAVGALKDDDRLKRTAFGSMEALGHSMIVTYALKFAAARERPGTGSGRGHFWSGYDRAFKGENSFPSGHSMEAWAAASVIAHEYSDNRYVPALAYGFASMVSVSRVAAQRHYAGDVFAGAAAGFLIGRLVHGGRAAALKPGGTGVRSGPSVRPVINPASRTAMLSVSWGGGGSPR